MLSEAPLDADVPSASRHNNGAAPLDADVPSASRHNNGAVSEHNAQ
ncbi:hypothetical protein MP638_006368 [Amoeboaphelidium occidentale]|nr:hypothetical protein MP638_006368 [Amoeboaphelidium occidentale]